MTLLALPKPGPPYSALTARAAAWSLKKPPRVRPRTDEPPTRSRSRRVMPSQVSLPGCPGITSMDQHLSWEQRVRWESEAVRKRAGGRVLLPPKLPHYTGVARAESNIIRTRRQDYGGGSLGARPSRPLGGGTL